MVVIDNAMDDLGFPARLRDLIGDRSVRSFSRRSGVSEGTLRGYLSGKTKPTAPKLAALARAGGTSMAWLAMGAGSRADLDTSADAVLAADGRDFEPQRPELVSGETARLLRRCIEVVQVHAPPGHRDELAVALHNMVAALAGSPGAADRLMDDDFEQLLQVASRVIVMESPVAPDEAEEG